MAAVARKIRVTGLVQGVFFRAWTQHQANEVGVLGWVRNCRDGSVEAHLEGDPAAVDQLIERLRKGPPAAEVQEIEIRDVEPEGFHHFDVARSL
ncbi:MAG: acylphosphatase [Sphingomonas sp.]|nr:acylphosphatase [Sphingomonas sp.]